MSRGQRRRPELPFGATVSRLNQYQRKSEGKPFRLRIKGQHVDDFATETEAVQTAIAMCEELFEPEAPDVAEDVDARTLARLRAAREEAQR